MSERTCRARCFESRGQGCYGRSVCRATRERATRVRKRTFCLRESCAGELDARAQGKARLYGDTVWS